ncbi:helix-turn-helix domain-containing protein [Clostridium botulinum]|uniref:helix-turn-helix domain-containing protein n=1 Tax=Clostridium botulinum TaxID=1491 RepID=UPI0013F0C108|nr:helix-turn-helix transcriptional regulator [Clostridium botulinum]MBY6950301.1 helix-turn-helix transcriptional regulator [Clostridium botulinum]MCR1138550.1 helix-turn-helix domain-containing protein [Clostridium botulinum]NEZ80096.1 XRE family transcriptional regulator [Clostridium botulinum]NFA16745.1 XRE family transcriptional regulator [Clostridium botulinum]NFA54162.1 XRE family transcriptional regulator [Clostridium botulinum]
MVTFGERLRNTRNSKDITLDKMAEDLQTTKATLSRYENNLREPKADFVKKIAEYLNVNLDYLLGSSDNMECNRNNEEVPNNTIKMLKRLIDNGDIKTSDDVTDIKLSKLIEMLKKDVDELLKD